MKHWKLISTSLVLDEFMKVEKRIYDMPDGTRKDFYIRISNPTVCTFALTKSMQVITAKQFRPGPNAFLNELPGGMIDEGEDPLVAAKRELLEETGYSGKTEFLTTCYLDAYNSVVKHYFVVKDCERVSEQILDESEHVNVELIELDKFKIQLKKGELTDSQGAYLALDYLKLL